MSENIPVHPVNAQGTSFSVGNTVVGLLKSISGIAPSAEAVDVTTLASIGGYKEYAPGAREGGEISLSGWFNGDDAGQAAVIAAFESNEPAACVVAFPAPLSKTWSFGGIITKYEIGASVGEYLSFDVSVKVSGKPTMAAAGG